MKCGMEGKGEKAFLGMRALIYRQLRSPTPPVGQGGVAVKGIWCYVGGGKGGG